MPQYEFECSNCKNKFTLTCSFEEKEKAVCPFCESNQLNTVFGSVSVIWTTNKE